MSNETNDELTQGLLESTSNKQRMNCAVKLMFVNEPEVKRAFIQALIDPFDKVVRVACMTLGHIGGADAVAPLLQVLEHDAWHSRLEACKALITLKAANSQVVSVLEQMAQEPDAAEYDALIRRFKEGEKDPSCPEWLKGRWGEIATILEQARQVAAQNS